MDSQNRQTFALRYSNPKESLRLAEEVVRAAEDNSSAMAYGLVNRYFAQLILSDPNGSVEDLMRAAEIFEELGNAEGKVLASSYLANHFESIGQFEKATGHLSAALSDLEGIADVVASQALATGGNVYFKMGHYAKALALQEQTLQLREKAGDVAGAAASYNQIGRTLGVMWRVDEAFAQYAKSYDIRKSLAEKGSLAWTLLGIGSLQLENGLLAEAVRSFEEAVTCLGPTDLRGKAHVLTGLGKAYLRSGDAGKALTTLDEARAAAAALKANDIVLELLALLAEANEQQGDTAKALELLKAHLELKEQTRQAELQMRIAQVERSMEAEYAVREAKVLKTKNEELAQKNRMITESITYASVIQKAILPTADALRQLLPQSFILYRPKDIVSGDFYWAAEADGKVMVAVGDCTGHGVPGAFMSMIGTDQLNHAVFEKGIRSPAKILEVMHRGVQRALKQDIGNWEANDGMELALCAFDPATGEVVFAGANRPLIVCSQTEDGTYELLETKPDKMGVGGERYSDEGTFTDHHLTLRPGDNFFLFSDGYADQFDAAYKTKFSTRRLKALLLEIAPLEAEAQHTAIALALDDWKGSRGQTDDIALFGMKY